MRILRQMTIAMIALGALVASTPAFAQSNTDAAPARLTLPMSTPLDISKTATFLPQTEKEQGLGVFLQGGFVRSSTYNESGAPGFDSLSPSGFFFGVGFGGNKSGAFGIGVDINYIFKSADDVTLLNIPDEFFANGEFDTNVLNIPVYGRINFFGHQTKNAPTLYVMFGGFIDILIKAKIDDLDVKDYFHGFDFGPMGGIGFEVSRIGIEARGQWAMQTLQSTGNGTFLNGLQESKAFSLLILFKVRVH
jgi:hypothetical protein